MRSVSLFRAKSATLLSVMYQKRSVCPALSPDVSPPQGLCKMLPVTPSRFQWPGLFPEKCVIQSPDKSVIQFSRRFLVRSVPILIHRPPSTLQAMLLVLVMLLLVMLLLVLLVMLLLAWLVMLMVVWLLVVLVILVILDITKLTLMFMFCC